MRAAMRRHVVKKCPCCGTRYSRAEWEALRLCGRMDHAALHIELRQCTCASTIALPVHVRRARVTEKLTPRGGSAA